MLSQKQQKDIAAVGLLILGIFLLAALVPVTMPTKMLWGQLISLSVVVSTLFRRLSLFQAVVLFTGNRFHSP